MHEKIIEIYTQYLPSKFYAVGLRNAENKWKIYAIKKSDLAVCLPAENSKYECYIKPLEYENAHHFIMVDGISMENINRMKLSGIIPAMVVESSPKHSWIRFKNPMNYKQTLATSRYLASEYHAKQKAVSTSCFGVFPGYKRTLKNGSFIPVLIETSETLNFNFDDKIINAEQEQSYEQFIHSYLEQNYDSNPEIKSPLQTELDEKCKEYINAARQERSNNAADLMAMTWLYSEGYSRGSIISAMLENSEGLIQRKNGLHNAQRYLDNVYTEVEKKDILSNQSNNTESLGMCL